MPVRYPFGAADAKSVEDAATSTIDIVDLFTIVDNANGLSQAVTALSIDNDQGLPAGATIMFDLLQGATGRNVTFGGAGNTIVAPVLTGVANDRDVLVLVWNGTDWAAQTATWNKIVDAV